MIVIIVIIEEYRKKRRKPVLVQFWILTRPLFVGVIPSGAVFQAKGGISG
jgi:hypothetical protein